MTALDGSSAMSGPRLRASSPAWCAWRRAASPRTWSPTGSIP